MTKHLKKEINNSRKHRSTEAEKEIDIKLGNTLKKYRLYRKMSRKRIAEKLGVSMTVIIGNENATLRVSVSRLFSYAKALGVNVNMLLNGGLIIEEGVCYKTRDGHKAFVFEVNNIDNKCYASVTGPTGGTFCMTMQGRVFEDKESNNDLIDLWREDNE